MIRKHFLFYLLLILLLGAALRASTLFSVELDRDEIWSLNWSRQDVTVELNHTLHLAMIAPFTRTMPDVVGSRIISFWAGILVIAASARLAYRAFGTSNRARTASLVTALLVSLSPYLIAYSQEGRGYMFAAALSVMGLVLWLEGHIWLSAIVWLFSAFAMSSAALVVVAVDVATLLIYFTKEAHRNAPLQHRRIVMEWIISHGLIYASVLLLSRLIELSPAGAYLPIILDEPPLKFLWRYLGVAQCGNGEAEILPCLALGLVLWPALILGTIVLVWRTKLYRNILTAAVVIVPVLAAAGLYMIHYGIFVHRHLIVTIPALLLLWTIVALHWRRWLPTFLTLLVAQSVLALVPYYQSNPYKPNWRQIVSYVKTHSTGSAETVVAEPTLLDMLAVETAYHFGQPVSSTLPQHGQYWYVALVGDAIPDSCRKVEDANVRGVSLYRCEG